MACTRAHVMRWLYPKNSKRAGDFDLRLGKVWRSKLSGTLPCDCGLG